MNNRRNPCIGLTRRVFLRQMAGSIVTGFLVHPSQGVEHQSAHSSEGSSKDSKRPWYLRTLRWGQTNITEVDPPSYDIPWWRQYWKQTRVQGVIVNAGGIVAYYPSKFPLHYRAKSLGDRDLYGELCQAAHQDGLIVLARMDSNRVHEDFFKVHPDWIARDVAGNPYKNGELYVTCINSPYYEEWIPNILQEIIERSQPEGITDNSWSGLGRNSICYCGNCTRRFKERTGKSIPTSKDWKSPTYREWIQWNYERRLEIWDLNNKTAQKFGGRECLWIGMNSGSISSQAQSFRDFRGICQRAEIIMLDHQARIDDLGFQQNAEAGKLIHGLLGWNKLIPESMAMYQMGRPTFRKTSKPAVEAVLWAVEGFAGGIQPWWHHVGAQQEDKRQFKTIESLNAWHERTQEYLVQRTPLATVGLVWSQQNLDFYGRDHAEDLVELPYRGMANALLRGRIPYVPIHADDIERLSPGLSALILPNLAAMSKRQIEEVARFVERGGGLLATGETSLFDEMGDPRKDYGLADLFDTHLAPQQPLPSDSDREKRASETIHSYLRVSAGMQHPVLKEFEDTSILPFGGYLSPLQAGKAALVPLSFVPAFPVYPPETSWMREPQTTIPGLILSIRPNDSRIAFLPADIDRRYGRDHLPDHGQLLENIVRWIVRSEVPLRVQGGGLLDCQLYQQTGRIILHLVNLTNAAPWRQPVEELVPVGPLRIHMKVRNDLIPSNTQLLVAERSIQFKFSDQTISFEIPSLLDHELVVIS